MHSSVIREYELKIRVRYHVDDLVKNQIEMAKKKVQDQGERIFRNEVYLSYAAMTKDEAQRRYWTFYEAIKFDN